jgi:hypothetical protein
MVVFIMTFLLPQWFQLFFACDANVCFASLYDSGQRREIKQTVLQ